jgi:hypothetical protein
MNAERFSAKSAKELPGSGQQSSHAASDVKEKSATSGPVGAKTLSVVVEVVVEDVLPDETNGEQNKKGPS